MLRRGRLPTRVQSYISRGFCHSAIILKSSKQPVSFFPTASVFDHESHEQRLRDQEAAVPTRPSFGHMQHKFKDMVKPQDVCDLLWKPNFEDYMVTCLAKESPLLGDPSYRVESKSTVNSTKLMFANISVSWLDDFKARCYELKNLDGREDDISYKNLDRELSQSVVQVLLSRQKKLAEYELIIKLLSEGVPVLNPVSIKDFMGYLIGDLAKKQQNNPASSGGHEKSFDTFLGTYLLPAYPELLSELSASTLDKLVLISSSSGNFLTAQQAFTVLVEWHKTSLSKDTWDTFMARYIKHATDQNLSKTQILGEIFAIKPVLFHHELSAGIFNFLLTRVVDNSHDLFHLVQLAQSSSPRILSEFGDAIIERLHQVSTTKKDPEIIKSVQVAQLTRTLKLAGFENAQ
ncbi:hypothetical protein JCM33374_g5705 [Metschnikowia sp. JCM 33374]|nr:hypothetical protein JCM33374_g5705 [Metschnikowia sp. JCM 33374]